MTTDGKGLPSRVRSFLAWHSRPLRGWWKHTVWQRLTGRRRSAATRLHVGSGARRLEGWINLDVQRLPEVDLARDVTAGLPLADVELVYAEHFLEHLPVTAALDFLLEVHRILVPDGRIRLSTPNLDWVWKHLDPVAGGEHAGGDRATMAMHANRAFYGWGHRFLWNRELLAAALTASGFARLRWCRYGESEIEAFRGIEGHATDPDTEALPHVLIVEATRGAANPPALAELRRSLREHFLDHL